MVMFVMVTKGLEDVNAIGVRVVTMVNEIGIVFILRKRREIKDIVQTVWVFLVSAAVTVTVAVAVTETVAVMEGMRFVGLVGKDVVEDVVVVGR